MSQVVPKWQNRFGLIGKRLDYSFSPGYFKSIFELEGLLDTHTYETWPLPDEETVRKFLSDPPFTGSNVTIPYKVVAADCCDVLVGHAAEIGAVNTLCRTGDQLIGYNTDVYGVLKTFSEMENRDVLAEDYTGRHHVLICGTGGASRAVQCACKSLQYTYTVLSRSPGEGVMTYDVLRNSELPERTTILVNTTPLGMVGLEDKMVDIDLNKFNEKLVVFDLIYTPKKTLLLRLAEQLGARIINGELMLHEQANLAWSIWKQINH